MFVWAQNQGRAFERARARIDFCLRMMDEAEVSLAPGRAFGEGGENCVRIALVENEHRLAPGDAKSRPGAEPARGQGEAAEGTGGGMIGFPACSL